MCKVFECIQNVIHSSIMDHFCNNKILTNAQHVFHIEGCTSPNQPYKRMHQNEQKSFKSISQSQNFPKHQTRYHTAPIYCISQNTTMSTLKQTWIHSQNENRKQSVTCEDTVSTLALIIHDVSQLQDTVSCLFQRHTKNSSFIRNKVIFG